MYPRLWYPVTTSSTASSSCACSELWSVSVSSFNLAFSQIWAMYPGLMMPGALWDVKVKLVCSVIELSRVKLKRKSQDYQEDAAAKRCKQFDCEPLQSKQKEALLPPNQSISETQLPIDYKDPLQSKDEARPQQITEEKLESPV